MIIKDLIDMYLKVTEIDGFITNKDIFILYLLAKYQDIEGDIVEIGSFKGKSTCCLMEGLKYRHEVIYAIDPHTGSKEHQKGMKYESGNTYDDFMKNVGSNTKVLPLIMTSKEALNHIKTPIRMVFIDGSHEYDDVLFDFVEYSKILIPEGIIVLHDTSKWQGPRRVTEEIMKNKGFIYFDFNDVFIAQKITT